MSRGARFLATTAVASVLVVTTSLTPHKTFPFSLGADQAYAGKGGNGGGNSGGRGGGRGGRDSEMSRSGDIGGSSKNWKRSGAKTSAAPKTDKDLRDTKAGRLATRGAKSARGFFGRVADTVKDKIPGRDKERVARAPKTVPAAKPDSKGATASKLGALNAAHASPTALQNASANSRVGRVAAYLDAMKAAGQYDEALADLEGMDEVTQGDIDAAAAVVESLEVDLGQLPADDPARADLEAELAEAQATLTDVETAYADYQEASKAVEELEDSVDGDPKDLLEAAANKPVDDDVKAAVDALLGLDATVDPTGESAAGIDQKQL